MDAVSYFKRLFAYDAWANREILRAIVAADPDNQEALGIMSHIVAAEHLWLDRLHGDEQSIPVWPKFNAQECAERLQHLQPLWTRFLDNQREDKLLRPIAYVNSKGQPWASRVEEILMHVVIHSAHHRGQVAAIIRQLGRTPPLVDFVHAVRTGLVQ